MNVDTPTPGATLTSAFEVGGWAIDTGAPTGTGVDAVQFYVFPNAGAAPGVFIGQGSYGWRAPDVGAAFGSRFTNSGYHFTITGLGPGPVRAGRLRAQHRDRHLQHRQHAALHRQRDGADVDRLAAARGRRSRPNRSSSRAGRSIARSSRRRTAAPASICCTSTRIRIPAAGRRRSSSASRRSASIVPTSARSTDRATTTPATR